MMNPELILLLIRAVNWIIKYYTNYNLHNPKWMDMNTSGKIVTELRMETWTFLHWAGLKNAKRKSQVLADVFLRNKNE